MAVAEFSSIVSAEETRVSSFQTGFLPLKIDTEISKKHCDNFCDYAGEFENLTLLFTDEKSTMIAVQNAIAEFGKFSEGSNLMGQTIKQDAINMHQKTEVIEEADDTISTRGGFSAGSSLGGHTTSSGRKG